MEKYTIYCTAEQTKKALELGAPIEVYAVEYDNSNRKANEFEILNDVVFTYGIDVCRNEYGELVYVTGEIYKRCAYYIPTAEQMIGFFRSKNIHIVIHKDVVDKWSAYGHEIEPIEFTVFDRLVGYSSFEEATLAAIDAALDYLINSSTKAE